jgi:Sec-independent protein translocase protein TatA
MEYAVTTMLAAFLGLWEFVIIIVILLLVFGTARFGKAFRSLKSGGREFKRGIRGKDELPPPDNV